MRDRIEAAGPLIVLVAAAALLVLSLMTWYVVDLDHLSVGADLARRYATSSGLATSADAWQPWGLVSDVLLFLVITGGIGLGVYGLLSGRSSIRAPAAAMVLGVVSTLVVGLHAVSEPQPRHLVSVQPPAWLAVAASIALLVGGALWWDRALHASPGSGAFVEE